MVREQPIPREERGLQLFQCTPNRSNKTPMLGAWSPHAISKNMPPTPVPPAYDGHEGFGWHVGGVLGDALRRYFVGPSPQVGSGGLQPCYRGKFPTIRLLECSAPLDNAPNGFAAPARDDAWRPLAAGEQHLCTRWDNAAMQKDQPLRYKYPVKSQVRKL